MEEIKIDFEHLDSKAALELTFLDELSNQARKSGVLVGVPWTGKVYEYFFENSSEDVIESVFSLYQNPDDFDFDLE